jgi:hypothetical protein
MTEKQNPEIQLAQAELLNALNQLRAIRGDPPLTCLPEPPFCSFCGRGKSEVGALVEGLDAHICGECADEARRLMLRG